MKPLLSSRKLTPLLILNKSPLILFKLLGSKVSTESFQKADQSNSLNFSLNTMSVEKYERINKTENFRYLNDYLFSHQNYLSVLYSKIIQIIIDFSYCICSFLLFEANFHPHVTTLITLVSQRILLFYLNIIYFTFLHKITHQNVLKIKNNLLLEHNQIFRVFLFPLITIPHMNSGSTFSSLRSCSLKISVTGAK